MKWSKVTVVQRSRMYSRASEGPCSRPIAAISSSDSLASIARKKRCRTVMKPIFASRRSHSVYCMNWRFARLLRVNPSSTESRRTDSIREASSRNVRFSCCFRPDLGLGTRAYYPILQTTRLVHARPRRGQQSTTLRGINACTRTEGTLRCNQHGMELQDYDSEAWAWLLGRELRLRLRRG